MHKKLYVVITERDCCLDEAYMNNGAIIMETYTKHADLGSAIKQAQEIGHRYGQAWIGEVTVLSLEQAEKIEDY